MSLARSHKSLHSSFTSTKTLCEEEIEKLSKATASKDMDEADFDACSNL